MKKHFVAVKSNSCGAYKVVAMWGEHPNIQTEIVSDNMEYCDAQDTAEFLNLNNNPDIKNHSWKICSCPDPDGI